MKACRLNVQFNQNLKRNKGLLGGYELFSINRHDVCNTNKKLWDMHPYYGICIHNPDKIWSAKESAKESAKQASPLCQSRVKMAI